MSTLALASAQGLLQTARIPDRKQRPAAAAMTELVQRAQGGDDEAFGALYRAHVGRVHALCLRLAGDAQSAGELTQDVFVRAWEALPSFRGESAFGSWLHRLAMNVFLGKRRATGRRERRVLTTDEPALLERSGGAGGEPSTDNRACGSISSKRSRHCRKAPAPCSCCTMWKGISMEKLPE